ncbi:DUF1007 family protein [Oceanicola granulosus]|nr:DUF1007 family protein [Oceanicola granulosus]
MFLLRRMTLRAQLSALALFLALPGAAPAHPHVFIDAGFELVFDEDGRLEAVRIEWAYDDFYSLMLIEENGLDADGDGIPEQAALDAYAGGDVDWAAGFPGDFTIEKDGAALALDGPVAHEARFEDGRYVTSHVRPLAEPLDPTGGRVVARAYDPTYFVAYDVPGEPAVIGRDDCALRRDRADREAAEQAYGEELAAIDMTADPFEEIDLPDIGVLFADAFVLTCAASS